MNQYQVKTTNDIHQVEAVTFTQGADLRFIGEQGAIVAIFTSFDWLKVIPVEEKPAQPDTSTTEAPALEGQ